MGPNFFLEELWALFLFNLPRQLFSWAKWIVYSIKFTTKTLYSTYIHSNKHVKLYMRSIQISQRQTTTLININHSHMNHSSFFLAVPSFSICWDRVNLWFGWGCMWWLLKPFILTQIFTIFTSFLLFINFLL